MKHDDQRETYLRSQYITRDSIEASEDPTAGPWHFGGVACAAGDILHTTDGKPVLLTAEELAKAEYAKPSAKLTVDHPEYDGGSPPVDSIVGNNSMHYSPDGEAIVYDAETHDEEIAAGVHNDAYDVSIHAGFEVGEKDPETAAYIARNIVFADLSVVGVGDSPSNTVEWGGRQEVAAWAHGGGLEAALSGDSDADDEGGVREAIRDLAQKAGLIRSDDGRGDVWFTDQTSDGETVVVDEAGFRDAPWMVSIHPPGDAYPDVGEGLGEAIGIGEPHGAGDWEMDESVTLDSPISEDQTLFSLLRYHADGEVSDPITTSDDAHFVDSAFVGVAPDGVMDGEGAEADASVSQSADPAESGRGAAGGSDTPMKNRDEAIEFITANSHFSEEVLADMDDQEVEQTRDLVDDDDGEGTEQNGGDGGADGGQDTATDDTSIGDMTPDELGQVLQNQGFVTQDDVAEASAQADKADQVDEIIAASPEYSEDDREDLMASTETVVEKIHKKETSIAAAPAPGVGGARSAAEASVGSTEEHDIDDFGTGVQE